MTRSIIVFVVAGLVTAAQPAKQEVVSLVAVDHQGQAVLDLKSGELQILDNGKPQTITSFSRIEKSAAAPLVVLFDLMNTRTGSRPNVQQQIVQSLQALPATSSVYVYLVAGDGKLFPVHGLNAAESTNWTQHVDTLLDDALHNVQVLRPANLDQTGARVKATYTVVAELANALSLHPGRKSIVWITHGVPLHGTAPDGTTIDYLPTLKKLAATLGEFHIVLYPVFQTESASVAGSDTSTDTLQQFAAITGGRVYPNSNIDKAIAGAASDAAAGYLLAYQPPNAKQDGKFHTIRVNCTRPGIRIQARQGYFAD